MENDILEKKMVRSTLKNVEVQLANHKSFLRCHRTRLVNIMYMDKLVRDFSGYSLKITCMEELLPVSRQFLMQVKDAFILKYK